MNTNSDYIYRLLYDLTYADWKVTVKQTAFDSILNKQIFGQRITLRINWQKMTAEASGEIYTTDRDILSYHKCAYNEK